jgi:ribonuclease P protein component
MPDQRALRGTGESLLPEERLRRRAEFVRCYKEGRRRHGPLATLYLVEQKGSATGPRLGITVTRKVGGAVVRHRLKRQIREIYRRWGKRRQLAPCDILVHVKPAAREADFHELQTEIQRLLRPLVRSRDRAG